MAESYRALRTSLLLTSLGAPPKTILITSALPREGKTTTSINTAIVLAQKGVRVLLIDADLRRPSIHKTLGMGPRVGLSNVLTGGTTLRRQRCVLRFCPTYTFCRPGHRLRTQPS
jgi:Mrp family chromosome partitioning ATPase